MLSSILDTDMSKHMQFQINCSLHENYLSQAQNRVSPWCSTWHMLNIHAMGYRNPALSGAPVHSPVLVYYVKRIKYLATAWRSFFGFNFWGSFSSISLKLSFCKKNEWERTSFRCFFVVEAPCTGIALVWICYDNSSIL